jgi:hypothetical protein
MNSPLQDLLRLGPVAVNLGLRWFALSLQVQGVRVVHIDWTPPQQLDDETKTLLDRLL